MVINVIFYRGFAMSSKVIKTVKNLRDKFVLDRKCVANWFPGHMAKGIKQMQNKLKSVDCIIEVHDARENPTFHIQEIPITGRNPNFYHLLSAARPRILILNKVDTAFQRNDPCRDDIARVLRAKMDDERILFTNCKNPLGEGVAQIVPTVVDAIKNSDRFNRNQLISHYMVMIIGIPNVGKSSVINALRSFHLRKGKGTRVGALPGITRGVLEKIKISEEPLIYLLDTPGVLQPNITNVHIAMKLALCATIEEHFIGVVTIADYLLFWLNKMGNFSYVEQFGLKEPTDDINELLIHLAVTRHKFMTIKTGTGNKVKHPDFDVAAHMFVRHFQEGKFGKIMLDSDMLMMEDLQQYVEADDVLNV